MNGATRWAGRRRSLARFGSRMGDARKYGIGPDDLVLDLGSGQDPHPRANILCDKFIVDNSERSCGSGLLVDRPLVLADATTTPFPDNAFDFVFCSHLLEHMDRPEALLQELQRIGKRGYIETPSKVYEKLWGWHFHRWYVTVEDSRLVLEEKPRPIFDEDLHGWFARQVQRSSVWNFVMPRLHDLELLSVLVWKNEIPYTVDRLLAAEHEGFIEAELDVPATLEALRTLRSRPRNVAEGVKDRIAAAGRRESDKRVDDLLRSLRCPQCNVVLVAETDRRCCPSCATMYPVIGDVHVALAGLDRGVYPLDSRFDE